MKKERKNLPVFENESDEADWWASASGRAFVKQKAAEPAHKGREGQGSPLVGRLHTSGSVQIALRLPEADLAEARRIAARKGIGYQTLIKMLLHEGLQREGRRQVSET